MTPRTAHELARKMPVGATVTHVDGWTGVVAVDYPANWHGLDGQELAHRWCGMGPIVCVTGPTRTGGGSVTAWYVPHVLTLVERPAAPARPRTRTRAGGAR